MYKKALVRDDHNRGALFNLGFLVGSSEKEEDHDEALELLGRAKAGAEEVDSWEVEPVWYLSSYWIAAMHHYRDNGIDTQEVAGAVHAKAEEVLGALTQPRSWWPPGNLRKRKPWELSLPTFLFSRQRRTLQEENNERLRAWLENFEPLTLVMYGAILASQKNKSADKAADERMVRSKIDKLAESEVRPPKLSYNLACYYSVLGENSDNAQSMASSYKKALKQLERSFETARYFIDEALKDPSLRGVRDDATTNERFTELCKKYLELEETKRADGLPLGRLAPVGKRHAERLKGAGVVSETDLIEKAGTPAAREAMAEKLDVSPDLLERWALLADLKRVPGIDAEEASLLDWARAGTLETLKGSDAQHLASLLDHLNQARPLAVQPPKVDEVQSWIAEASKLHPQVRARYRRSKSYLSGYWNSTGR